MKHSFRKSKIDNNALNEIKGNEHKYNYLPPRWNKIKTGTEWIGTAGGRIISGLTGKQRNNWLDNMYKLLGSFQSL